MAKAPRKRRKKASDLTNDEMLRRLFPKPLREELKRVVRESNKPSKKRP